MRKNLSRKSIEILLGIKEAVLANPKFYDQNSFVEDISICDTTCCLAGWADYTVNGSKAHNKRAKNYLAYLEDFDSGKDVNWEKIGAKALGLPALLAYKLFVDSTEWPHPFDERYQNARTYARRARVAANRIDHFIATDGME